MHEKITLAMFCMVKLDYFKIKFGIMLTKKRFVTEMAYTDNNEWMNEWMNERKKERKKDYDSEF